MPTVVTQTTYFTVDGIPSDTPAWNVENVDELLRPADTRGAGGVAIIEAHGRLATRLWRDESARVLRWTINGCEDWEGVPYTDVLVGVETNLRYLLDNVVAVPDNADSTRDLVLYLPSGATSSGPVQVKGFEWAAAGPHLVGAMEICIPAGELALNGS